MLDTVLFCLCCSFALIFAHPPDEDREAVQDAADDESGRGPVTHSAALVHVRVGQEDGAETQAAHETNVRPFAPTFDSVLPVGNYVRVVVLLLLLLLLLLVA